MNIIDAIKSGKPFRRKRHSDGNIYLPDTEYSFTIIEVLADDWEIKEEARELTWADIVNELRQCADLGYINTTQLKQLLGFKE